MGSEIIKVRDILKLRVLLIPKGHTEVCWYPTICTASLTEIKTHLPFLLNLCCFHISLAHGCMSQMVSIPSSRIHSTPSSKWKCRGLALGWEPTDGQKQEPLSSKEMCMESCPGPQRQTKSSWLSPIKWSHGKQKQPLTGTHGHHQGWLPVGTIWSNNN